jgi:dUTPase
VKKTELTLNTLDAVHTGINIEFPIGYDVIIKEKYRLALKVIEIKDGVIDHEYRGEVLVLVKNKSTSPIILEPKLSLLTISEINFVPAKELYLFSPFL